jgi:hypothetical protein
MHRPHRDIEKWGFARAASGAWQPTRWHRFGRQHGGTSRAAHRTSLSLRCEGCPQSASAAHSSCCPARERQSTAGADRNRVVPSEHASGGIGHRHCGSRASRADDPRLEYLSWPNGFAPLNERTSHEMPCPQNLWISARLCSWDECCDLQPVPGATPSQEYESGLHTQHAVAAIL